MKNIVTGLLLIWVTQTFGQQSFGTWQTLIFNKQITDHASVFIAPQLRILDFQTNTYFNEVGFGLDILEHFNATLIYRIAKDYEDEGYYSTSNRLALDFTNNAPLSKLNVESRLRFTRKYNFESKKVSSFARLRAVVDYPLENKKFAPFIFAETFYNIEPKSFTRLRYSMGIDYEINARYDFTLAYVFQHEIDDQHFKHILDFDFNVNF